jgi:Uma2 family endonuclease
MSAVPAVRFLTVEEYLEMEDASTEKHEFIGGQVYAMAGASFAHNQIASNTLIGIGSFLRDKPCRIYGSDLKIHVNIESGFAYPDLSIVCDGAQFLEGRKDIVTNPCVLIEVLSPDTHDYDHGKKFMLYRQIPTLQEYILISSMEVLVEKFIRHESGAWTLTEYRNLDDKISFETINYQTTLAAFYRDVVFEENEELRGKGIVRESE